GIRRVAIRVRAPLGHDDCAVAEHQLDTMVLDAQALAEAKGFTQPRARASDILVAELGNDRGRWYRAIYHHVELHLPSARRHQRTQGPHLVADQWLALAVNLPHGVRFC